MFESVAGYYYFHSNSADFIRVSSSVMGIPFLYLSYPFCIVF